MSWLLGYIAPQAQSRQSTLLENQDQRPSAAAPAPSQSTQWPQTCGPAYTRNIMWHQSEKDSRLFCGLQTSLFKDAALISMRRSAVCFAASLCKQNAISMTNVRLNANNPSHTKSLAETAILQLQPSSCFIDFLCCLPWRFDFTPVLAEPKRQQARCVIDSIERRARCELAALLPQLNFQKSEVNSRGNFLQLLQSACMEHFHVPDLSVLQS